MSTSYRFAVKPVRKERKEFHSTTSLKDVMPAKLHAMVKTEKLKTEARFQELHDLLEYQLLKVGKRTDIWEKMRTDKIWQLEIREMCESHDAWSETMHSVRFMYSEFKHGSAIPVKEIGEKNFARAMMLIGF